MKKKVEKIVNKSIDKTIAFEPHLFSKYFFPFDFIGENNEKHGHFSKVKWFHKVPENILLIWVLF